jgi:hypothetical protein
MPRVLDTLHKLAFFAASQNLEHVPHWKMLSSAYDFSPKEIQEAKKLEGLRYVTVGCDTDPFTSAWGSIKNVAPKIRKEVNASSILSLDEENIGGTIKGVTPMSQRSLQLPEVPVLHVPQVEVVTPINTTSPINKHLEKEVRA